MTSNIDHEFEISRDAPQTDARQFELLLVKPASNSSTSGIAIIFKSSSCYFFGLHNVEGRKRCYYFRFGACYTDMLIYAYQYTYIY